MIKSHGSSNPLAFFVADFPTGKDLDTGYALTGYSADVLKDFLKDQSLDLNNFWRSCLIKEPIPLKLSKDQEEAYIHEKALSDGKYLIDEINDLKPHLIIPLGELGFSYLTNLRGIRKFRGSILPPSGEFSINQPNLKVLPILGPYPYLNQEYRLRVITRVDFGKIHKYLNDGPIPDNTYNIWVARTSSALRNFFQRSYEKCWKEGGYLCFDIETYFQIPICISFCFDGFESVCVPLLDNTIDLDNRALMMQQVAKLLKSPLPKVNQNIKYDKKIMQRWGFEVNNVVGDTMLAASCIYSELPKNLGFLTSIYTELPYFKDEGKRFDPEKTQRGQYYKYNAKDSLAAHQIYKEQLGELTEMSVKPVYDNLVKVMPIYSKMEDRGIRIDRDQQLKLLCKYESLYHIHELMLRTLLNRSYFNPLSTKQCADVIFNELGYQKVRGMKSTKDGSPSTDEESLDLLAVNGDSKVPNAILILRSIVAARKIHKVIEILELHLHPDDRFRCEFNLAGTENGRSSAGETTDQFIYLDEKGKIKVTNLGHSLQTIGKHGFMIAGITYGKDLRAMFVPSPGFTFVEGDLKGAEARVDRVLGGNFDMSIFDGPGIHKLTASWIYDCSPADIKKNILIDGVDRYHMGKTTRHAAERNMTPDRLVMMTQRPIYECKQILNKLHDAEPFIKKVFHADVRKALDTPGHCLVAPNGRMRTFFDRIDKATYNEGISFLPQTIVSDQTKFAGILKTFSEPGIYEWANLLAEQHDGTLAEVKNDRVYEYAELYKANIESEPIDFRTCTLSRDYQLVIPCEISVGDNWYNMTEVELETIKAA